MLFNCMPDLKDINAKYIIYFTDSFGSYYSRLATEEQADFFKKEFKKSDMVSECSYIENEKIPHSLVDYGGGIVSYKQHKYIWFDDMLKK